MVLGVTGGIAAYKTVQVARDLTALGAQLDVVLTQGATRFVAPLSYEGVTGRSSLTDMFSTRGAALHIRVARDADTVLVAPATADFVARAAQGRANDLLTTILLATRAPVIVAPAMNDRMFDHPQTRANLQHLEEVLGYRVAGPGSGPLAYGEGEGPGRMLEPDELVEHVGRALESPDLEGRRVLITAGPTREPLDPVRYLGNRSSGRMGQALARAAWRRGGEVSLVSGPSQLDAPPGVEWVAVETALEMVEAVRERAERADLVIYAAAVADYRPAAPHDEKVKRSRSGPRFQVELEANPDVSQEVRPLLGAGTVTVGFALETDALREGAGRKLEEKGFDLIVANDARAPGAGFEVDTNRVLILHAGGGEEELPLLSKDQVAEEILERALKVAARRW